MTCATHDGVETVATVRVDPWHVRHLTSRVVMLAIDSTVPVRDAVTDVVRRAGGDAALLEAVASQVRVHVTRRPGEAAERALAIVVVAIDASASITQRTSRSGYAVAS